MQTERQYLTKLGSVFAECTVRSFSGGFSDCDSRHNRRKKSQSTELKFSYFPTMSQMLSLLKSQNLPKYYQSLRKRQTRNEQFWKARLTKTSLSAFMINLIPWCKNFLIIFENRNGVWAGSISLSNRVEVQPRWEPGDVRSQCWPPRYGDNLSMFSQKRPHCTLSSLLQSNGFVNTKEKR